ncbi:hypothetical protein [Cyanobium sp. CH-040]|uniref:hypothetical protein n=1 Tax=Cyanobium sp. CH-040 TaxID=2823708 RepID=UPI0020CEDD7C|nr:hypothetical protein [Cyanobium sp. CH-040]MCP9927569.1 hypothetical protein [Cyanobium sp. CH-040]
MDAVLARHCGIADPQGWRPVLPEGLETGQQNGQPIEQPIEQRIDRALIREFALPLLCRLRLLVQRGLRPSIGLNAPVGAGKSTLCRLLAQLAQSQGLRLAVASIDDLYLPWPQRLAALQGNPFAVSRVPPGSHDVALLCRSLDRWRAGDALVLPRFDKTLRGGEGDRCGEQVSQADALLLEGWLLGCRPLGAALGAVDLEAVGRGAPDPSANDNGPLAAGASLAAGDRLALSAAERAWLPRWDQALQGYLPAWRRLDELWLLRPQRWSWPRRWRFQAEARQRRAGGHALAAEALERLVRASLCSLPPELYQDPLITRPLDSGSGLPAVAVGVLDGRRRLIAARGLIAADPARERVSDQSSEPSSSVSMG